jgi:hypothetical protein
MRLVWQWVTLERELPPDWSDVQLVLKVREQDAAQAAALLGGANPLRGKDSIRLYVSRKGGFGPEALKRALLRLDRKDIVGTLEVAGIKEAEPPPEEERRTLARRWDQVVATLPPDWSDMLAEVGLRSSDHLEYAALLMAPTNPTRSGKELALQFRVARRFGYGVSPAMARRSLERLDDEGIRGELKVLRVLSDTEPVATQGPVWRVGGRAV